MESDGKPSFLMEPINNLSARRGDMLEDDAWPEWPHSSEAGDAVGVDVSDYQGTIDWSKVAGAGYSFAFIKATEGEGWKGDAKARQQNFRTNMQGASSAGMLVGAYHFARPDLGNSAEDEARWFVDVAGDYIKPGYLRPVLDIEIGSADLSSWVNEWIETVTSETGVEPLIYTNAYYSSNYLDNSVKRYDLWISHWTYDPTRSPNTGIWDSWAFWQYSDMGEVPGIAGDVDLNIFRGSESELSYYVISASSTGADFPNVYEFQVTQLGIILGDFFTIDYTVSDNSGPGLKQVELWCKDETSDWQEIDRNNLAGESGPITGSFTDSPPAPGTYWYGVHVVDNAGNWNDERNSNTNYQPVSFEPVEVEVIDSSSAQGSTNCDSAEAKSWFERGVAFYDQFDYTEAIDCFDEATKICPQYEAAWGKMGDAYLIGRFGFFSDNNPNEAIRCCQRRSKTVQLWRNKTVHL
jgi:lysozyme